MAAMATQYLGAHINLTLFPFMSPFKPTITGILHPQLKTFDFIYVASGEPHKNHQLLFDAWRLLAEAGLRPSLAVTLDPDKYSSLCENLKHAQENDDVAIENLGYLNGEDVNKLYQSASALIFPSKIESFGLPLLDAASYGLPILASELDYVRDLVTPVETFDPCSAMSIARAVKRFLGVVSPNMPIFSAESFLAKIMD